MGEPEILFRGIAHADDPEELTAAAKKVVIDLLDSPEMRQVSDVGVVKSRLHDVLQKYLRQEANRRPMVLPVVVEV
jgi:ribonuclease J